MLVLLPTLLVLLSSAIFASISWRARKRRDRSPIAVPTGFAGAASNAVNATRLRMLAAVISGVLVFALLTFAPIPALHLSLGLAIAPGVGALVACLMIAAFPMPRALPSAGVRQADLTPRDTTSFGPRWGFILPLVAAGLYVLFLLATASLSSTADYSHLSRQIALETPAGYQTSSPYPGWYYAGPMLLVIVGLSATALVALRRIAGARALGPHDLAPLDVELRRAMTRFVMLLSSSIIVLYLGATALIAGSALRNVSQWSKMTAAGLSKVSAAVPPNYSVKFGPGDFVNGIVEPQYTAGAIEAVVGLVLIAFALLLLILAFAAFSVRWSATPAGQPTRESVSA